eukprot:TRINITY_DN13880_c0_g1_i1.p2 TRINITY_DN13880_c0_g1~~TRINITY_DN13880_c0_g1_i1.p2  ORF type:complete len:342 (-),score=104.12 TRINITY_DN13880_c0_g1_i1:113-1012(-)
MGYEAPKEVNVEIAIIGGTGVYGVEGLTDVKELDLDTPFGKPSSLIRIGKIDGVSVAFLARHDVTHRLAPSEVPYQANIYALKMIGVKYILAFGATGSLREEVKPLDIVLVDQFIDRTKSRKDTFFGNGVIAHISFGTPVCETLKGIVKKALDEIKFAEGVVVHNSGTYICMEGLAFSTKAESNMYRMWGGTVIGMTALPEAKLAREAEIAYCTVALATDYDCWHPDHDQVTVEMVIKNLKQNGVHAQDIVKGFVKKLSESPFESAAHNALQYAILTHHISDENKERLKYIIGKYAHLH